MATLKPVRFLAGTLSAAAIAFGSAQADTTRLNVSDLPNELTAPAHPYIDSEAPKYVPADMLTGVSLRNAVADFSSVLAVASKQMVTSFGTKAPALDLITFSSPAQGFAMVSAPAKHVPTNAYAALNAALVPTPHMGG